MSDMTTEEWIEAEYPGLFADLKTHAENGAPEDFARLAAISLREHDKSLRAQLAELKNEETKNG